MSIRITGIVALFIGGLVMSSISTAQARTHARQVVRPHKSAAGHKRWADFPWRMGTRVYGRGCTMAPHDASRVYQRYNFVEHVRNQPQARTVSRPTNAGAGAKKVQQYHVQNNNSYTTYAGRTYLPVNRTNGRGGVSIQEYWSNRGSRR